MGDRQGLGDQDRQGLGDHRQGIGDNRVNKKERKDSNTASRGEKEKGAKEATANSSSLKISKKKIKIKRKERNVDGLRNLRNLRLKSSKELLSKKKTTVTSESTFPSWKHPKPRWIQTVSKYTPPKDVTGGMGKGGSKTLYIHLQTSICTEWTQSSMMMKQGDQSTGSTVTLHQETRGGSTVDRGDKNFSLQGITSENSGFKRPRTIHRCILKTSNAATASTGLECHVCTSLYSSYNQYLDHLMDNTCGRRLRENNSTTRNIYNTGSLEKNVYQVSPNPDGDESSYQLKILSQPPTPPPQYLAAAPLYPPNSLPRPPPTQYPTASPHCPPTSLSTLPVPPHVMAMSFQPIQPTQGTPTSWNPTTTAAAAAILHPTSGAMLNPGIHLYSISTAVQDPGAPHKPSSVALLNHGVPFHSPSAAKLNPSAPFNPSSTANLNANAPHKPFTATNLNMSAPYNSTVAANMNPSPGNNPTFVANLSCSPPPLKPTAVAAYSRPPLKPSTSDEPMRPSLATSLQLSPTSHPPAPTCGPELVSSPSTLCQSSGQGARSPQPRMHSAASLPSQTPYLGDEIILNRGFAITSQKQWKESNKDEEARTRQKLKEFRRRPIVSGNDSDQDIQILAETLRKKTPKKARLADDKISRQQSEDLDEKSNLEKRNHSSEEKTDSKSTEGGRQALVQPAKILERVERTNQPEVTGSGKINISREIKINIRPSRKYIPKPIHEIEKDSKSDASSKVSVDKNEKVDAEAPALQNLVDEFTTEEQGEQGEPVVHAPKNHKLIDGQSATKKKHVAEKQLAEIEHSPKKQKLTGENTADNKRRAVDIGPKKTKQLVANTPQNKQLVGNTLQNQKLAVAATTNKQKQIDHPAEKQKLGCKQSPEKEKRAELPDLGNQRPETIFDDREASETLLLLAKTNNPGISDPTQEVIEVFPPHPPLIKIDIDEAAASSPPPMLPINNTHHLQPWALPKLETTGGQQLAGRSYNPTRTPAQSLFTIQPLEVEILHVTGESCSQLTSKEQFSVAGHPGLTGPAGPAGQPGLASPCLLCPCEEAKRCPPLSTQEHSRDILKLAEIERKVSIFLVALLGENKLTQFGYPRLDSTDVLSKLLEKTKSHRTREDDLCSPSCKVEKHLELQRGFRMARFRIIALELNIETLLRVCVPDSKMWQVFGWSNKTTGEILDSILENGMNRNFRIN